MPNKTPKSDDQSPLNSNLSNLTSISRSECKKLSYEDSFHFLNLILEKLQDDKVPLDELQIMHSQGKIYLDHCLSLLNKVEQEVIQADEI